MNTLAPPGLVARLHADYERNGTLDATEAEHLVRLLRPGAILLANLDISDMSQLPSPAPKDLVPLLDCKDTQTNGAADEKQLTAVRTDGLVGDCFARTGSGDARRCQGCSPHPGVFTSYPRGAHSWIDRVCRSG